MRGVNLIPAHVRLAAARRVRLRAWAVIAATWALALAGVYTWMPSAATELRDWDAPAAQIRQATDGVRQEADRLRAQLTREQALLASSQSIVGQPDWSMLLALISRAAGETIWIESSALKKDAEAPAPAPLAPRKAPRMVLSLAGMGETQDAVAAFALRLERIGLFDLVRVLEARRRENNGVEAVAFRLECLLEAEP